METPYPIYFEQALTCTRILSRILPFLLESESESKFIKDLFWNRSVLKKEADQTLSASPSKEVRTTNVDSENALSSEPPIEVLESKSSENIVDSEMEPLAVILINSIFHLLFLPDFTIEDPNADFTEDDLQSQRFKNALMYAPGVGSTEKSIAHSTQYDRNRMDVLRLMMAAFCDSLFQDPDRYDSSASMWLEVATSVDTPYAEIVFYSLMNVVLGKCLPMTHVPFFFSSV